MGQQVGWWVYSGCEVSDFTCQDASVLVTVIKKTLEIRCYAGREGYAVRYRGNVRCCNNYAVKWGMWVVSGGDNIPQAPASPQGSPSVRWVVAAGKPCRRCCSGCSLPGL